MVHRWHTRWVFQTYHMHSHTRPCNVLFVSILTPYAFKTHLTHSQHEGAQVIHKYDQTLQCRACECVWCYTKSCFVCYLCTTVLHGRRWVPISTDFIRLTETLTLPQLYEGLRVTANVWARPLGNTRFYIDLSYIKVVTGHLRHGFAIYGGHPQTDHCYVDIPPASLWGTPAPKF